MSADKIVLLGGLMLSAGMLATAFFSVVFAWLMYISYGVIGGFGVGAGYNTIVSAAQKWFPQNRGFATGLSVCAFGFSTVVFAPLVGILVRQFGIRSTFMILSAVFLIVVLALFRLIRLPDDSNPASAVSAALLEKKQYTMSETVKTKQFYFLACSMMLATAAFFFLNPSLKIFAADRGLSEAVGTALVMLTGVANAVGRLAVPLLSDRIGREKTTTIIILVTALGSLLLCFVEGPLFMATVAMIVFCFVGFPGMYAVLTADYFGIKNVGANYGAVMVGFALSALCFPMIIGLIGNNVMQFVALAVLAVIGAVLIRLLVMSKKDD
jgi:OFA family oxalate/formate antiporter-like MFS transporter